MMSQVFWLRIWSEDNGDDHHDDVDDQSCDLDNDGWWWTIKYEHDDQDDEWYDEYVYDSLRYIMFDYSQLI